MKKSKKIFIVFGIILVVILFLIFILLIGNENNSKNRDDDKVIIKDKVNIITSDTGGELQPTNVTEDTILFDYDPGYEVGEIVVAGITDAAPNGFIRRITDLSITDKGYQYTTEYAVLTDVFEEAHIIKTFAVTDKEVREIEEVDKNVKSLNLSSTADGAAVRSIAYVETTNTAESVDAKIKPSDNGLGVAVEFNYKDNENLEINGDFELITYIELKIDIEDDEIKFGATIHTDTNGELFVGAQEEVFDKDNKDNKDNFNGEHEKEIISKSLPNIQFAIGPVPVVITNDLKLSAEISTQLEGEIGTAFGLNMEAVSGYEYSSKTNKVVEINENNYFSDGIEFETKSRASGNLEAGIYVHLVTKLYGSSGSDLAVGIAGDLSGELALNCDNKSEHAFYGKLSLSMGPKASGKIVVEKPVIDHKLLEMEIFKADLPAFWEKEWETPDPILKAIENGDFSCFAGTYVATPEDNKAYGSGLNLNPIELKKNGSIVGGGAYYYPDIYPKTKPISVSKNEDGSYKCVWETTMLFDPEFPDEEGIVYESYYTIYPVGVIEDDKYVRENQAYLKDVVYIHCVYVDGGVMDAIYYYDNIANTAAEYRGKNEIL